MFIYSKKVLRKIRDRQLFTFYALHASKLTNTKIYFLFYYNMKVVEKNSYKIVINVSDSSKTLSQKESASPTIKTTILSRNCLECFSPEYVTSINAQKFHD